MSREAHNSEQLARPVGPFSHAVKCGELVFLSGQVGQEPATGKLVDGGVIEQTRQIFNNARVLLSELKLSLHEVVKVNVFLSTMDDFAAMNTVYAEYFTPPYPARTTVAVRELPMRAFVEMEMVARFR
jgi:2-iminobutanoate/2-iminopropanoate deaminase